MVGNDTPLSTFGSTQNHLGTDKPNHPTPKGITTMNLEQHVTSLELSKRLKELGVPQDNSHFVWGGWVKRYVSQVETRKQAYAASFRTEASAFLASELGEMLPTAVWNTIRNVGNKRSRRAVDFNGTLFMADTEADARAKLLIHLIEQGIVDPKTL